LRGYDSVPDAVLSRAELRTIPWLMIEALIAESVIPVAATGSFARMEGFGFLQMVERKVRWLQAHADHLVATVDQASEPMQEAGKHAMKTRHGLLFCFPALPALLLFCMSAHADPLTDLDAADYAVREAATEALLTDDALTLEQVSRWLAEDLTLEQRHR